jgi:DNA ligase 1
MKKFARLMEAIEKLTPTQQASVITTEIEKFDDVPLMLSIMAMEYPSNNMGLARAKKWVAKSFNVFEDDVESVYRAMTDLGSAVKYFDGVKQQDENYTLANLLNLITMDCNNADAFATFDEALSNMSAVERKWFIRYWLKIPRNGINEGVVKKFIAKIYDKKLGEVKKHCNFNSIRDTSESYAMGETPDIKMTHGKPVRPMLAKAIPKNKWPKDKIVDYKYDGNRYQLHINDGNAILFNRKCKVVNSQYADVLKTVINYPNGIYDGEIYPIYADGSPAPHQKLATRTHSKNIEEAKIKCPVKWVMFDVMMIDGLTVMDRPYRERVSLINDLPFQAKRSEGDIIGFYNQAIADGFEGIIVKDANAPYESGKRSKYWAKYKPARIELDVVIVGGRFGDGARANVYASFEIGVKSPSGYTSIGSVGTGLSEDDLLSLTNQLRPLVHNYKDGKYEFLPRIVLEVNADLITKSKGNVSLRFPRVSRIREDKYAADVNTLREVLEMV